MTKAEMRTNARGPKGPVQMLESELLGLRRDLRATLRALDLLIEEVQSFAQNGRND